MAVNSLQSFSKFHIFFITYLYFYTFFQSIPGDHFKFVIVNAHSRSFSPFIFRQNRREGTWEREKEKRETCASTCCHEELPSCQFRHFFPTPGALGTVS